MAVPESCGGDGAGWVELAIAAEALGQYLAPVPLIEAAVAGGLLACIAGLAPGEGVATLALSPTAGGVARLVPAGAVAELVVVLRGEELLLVEQRDKPAAAVPNLGSMPLADCPVPEDAVVLAKGEEAVAAWSRGVRQWRLLTAAALAGLAARALDIGLGYVVQRRAFGVLIGSFQTVQHRLADHATSVDDARPLWAGRRPWSRRCRGTWPPGPAGRDARTVPRSSTIRWSWNASGGSRWTRRCSGCSTPRCAGSQARGSCRRSKGRCASCSGPSRRSGTTATPSTSSAPRAYWPRTPSAPRSRAGSSRASGPPWSPRSTAAPARSSARSSPSAASACRGTGPGNATGTVPGSAA